MKVFLPMLLVDFYVFISFWIDNRIANAILLREGHCCARAASLYPININHI